MSQENIEKEKSDENNKYDWVLMLFASVAFASLPFLFLTVSFEFMLIFFSAAIATKWFIFSIMSFAKAHPKRFENIANKIDIF